MADVIISAGAEDDLAEAYRYNSRAAPRSVDAWLARINASVQTLETSPERCAVVENTAAYGFEVRELLFGKHRGTYRIRFRIRDSTVIVLSIRRATRDG